MHTISQRRKLHITSRADPPVIRRTWELHVWSIAHPRYYCFYMERKKPENAGTAEGRESSVFQAEDAKANNTQHTLRGKCGNTGWEVRQWKLRYSEQRDLGERRRGRGMATQAVGADFYMIQRETVLTEGVCRVWKRQSDSTDALGHMNTHWMCSCRNVEICFFPPKGHDLLHSGSSVTELLLYYCCAFYYCTLIWLSVVIIVCIV